MANRVTKSVPLPVGPSVDAGRDSSSGTPTRAVGTCDGSSERIRQVAKILAPRAPATSDGKSGLTR